MRAIIALALIVALCGCVQEKPSMPETLTVKSSFERGGEIPAKYTCDGADVSPPLYIEGIAENVKSLVIICEDPDAPTGVFTHWIAWNVEPASVIPENIPKQKEVSSPRMIQGVNDFGRVGYNGPCPPSGKHRYFFKVYALDTVLQGDYSKAELLKLSKAMFCSMVKFTAFMAGRAFKIIFGPLKAIPLIFYSFEDAE